MDGTSNALPVVNKTREACVEGVVLPISVQRSAWMATPSGVVSPPLDDAGNSVRAQRAIAEISNALGGNPLAAATR